MSVTLNRGHGGHSASPVQWTGVGIRHMSVQFGEPISCRLLQFYASYQLSSIVNTL